MRIIIAGLLFLTACTAEDMAQFNREMEAQRQAELQAVEFEKQQYCSNAGAPKGSKDYYSCRRELDQMILSKQERDREYELQKQQMMLNHMKTNSNTLYVVH